jgi:hypothetical protein
VFVDDAGNEERYGRTCKGLPPDIINFQHDPLACAVALGWHGATTETLPLATKTVDGWLRLRSDARSRPVRVVTEVDGAAFNARWLDAVAPPPRR